MKSSYEKVRSLIIIFLITIAFEGQAAVCPSTTSSVYTFGENCEFMCHCKSDREQCNETTGDCTVSGCGNAWMGPGCQYRDMAFGGYSKHLDNLEFVPDAMKKLTWAKKAIDGNVATCSMTAESNSTTAKNRIQDPFWTVLLPHDEIVTRLLIQTKLDMKEQLRGLQILVEHVEWSKRTSTIFPANSPICYTHTPSTPLETSMEVYCEQPLVGNHIRFQLPNKTAQIVLCDVRIYGGRESAFGRRSNQSSNFDPDYLSHKAVDGYRSSPNYCSLTKNEQNPWWRIDFGYNINVQAIKIYQFSGSVNINTTNIYTAESDVDELVLLQHYQQSTTNSLTSIVFNSLLNARQLMISTSLTGKLGFCEVQVFGDCPSNQCGWNCEKTCHCRSPVSPVDRIAGICINGCEGRWVSTSNDHNYCDTECRQNTWGRSCSSTCGNCLNGAACGITDGVCHTGCDVGYETTARCNTKCSFGKYGKNCSSDCSGHCIGNDSSNCNHIDGSCQGGCETGWIGSTCDEECLSGKYGDNCSKDCSGHCIGNDSFNCDHIDGSCHGGCEAGWTDVTCDQECSLGKYDEDCSKDCSGHCKGNNRSHCHRIDGSCTEGCEDGWRGFTCDEECSFGKYGSNCSKDCSGHCIGNNNSGCDHIDGSCQGGCEAGWTGSICDQECSAGKYG